MKQSTPKRGRPSFRIDGKRLTKLREEAGYSQLALAKEVYHLAGKGKSTSDATMKTTAGRWEAKGTIPPDMVRHLATALKTTIAVLQGGIPEPAPSRTEEFETRLRELISNSTSPDLAQALEDCEDDPNPVLELATRITGRLETAQLSQAQQVFKELAALTGYSVAELIKPTSQHGFWVLTCTRDGVLEESAILRGASVVRCEVDKELREFFEGREESDTHVAFMRDRHWIQVRMHHPRIPGWSRTLRFARCQPNEHGLQWVSPTWLDDFWLEDMPRKSYAHANFVTGFDAMRIPADCTKLRFAITRNPSAEEIDKFGLDAAQETVALIEGNLAELHPETLENFKREGSAHYLAVNRLTGTLWENLLPWMPDWPLEYWSISTTQCGIAIRSEVPYRLWVTNKLRPQFFQLHVKLVEQLADGTTRPAPWAPKSIAYVFDRLNTSLQEARQVQAHSPPGTSPA